VLLPFYAMAMRRAYATGARDRAVRIELWALAALGLGSLTARTLVHAADDGVTFPSTLPAT
jgi:hypothetical protein